MPTISLEISDPQHERLADLAKKKGQDIETYVLSCALDDADLMNPKNQANLAKFLEPRVQEALDGKLSSRSFDEIIAAARRDSGLV